MSREFIREDYLKVEIILDPVLPAREVAIAWLSELEFEVFEPSDTGLTVYAPQKVISPQELLDVRLRLEGIASVKWEESIVTPNGKPIMSPSMLRVGLWLERLFIRHRNQVLILSSLHTCHSEQDTTLRLGL